MNSITRNNSPRSSPISKTLQIKGWSSAAAAEASRRTRSRAVAFAGGGIGGQMPGQHLDGYLPAEFGVLGAVHLAHTAGADGGEDFVRAEFVAGRERHVRESS